MGVHFVTLNQRVAGSIPARLTKNFKDLEDRVEGTRNRCLPPAFHGSEPTHLAITF